MPDLIESTTLMLVLLNPFLILVYLVDVVEKLERRSFAQVMLRAGLIAAIVFSCFSLVGDAIFSELLHAEFASFQIFGGIAFLLIGLQFVFKGPTAIEILRGDSAQLAGAIAMPVLIGPGTISASVLIGKRHDSWTGCAVVMAATAGAVLLVLVLKRLHDFVRPRNEPLVQRSVEVTGRIVALYIGTVAVDMIMQGTRTWVEKF